MKSCQLLSSGTVLKYVASRRVHTAPHPNAVWHIDGNHKMIRWRLVVHGGVDGFSRCVTYMKCANNNCASTVLDAFLEALGAYGTPLRVRSDHGGENIDVWRHMLSIYNDHACVITGKSIQKMRGSRECGETSLGAHLLDSSAHLML